MLSTSVVSSRLSCSIYVAQAELYSILLKAPGFSESEYWLNVSCIQSVQLLSRVRLFMIPWTAALQASLSTTKSQSLLKLMSIESMKPSNRFLLCCPLLFLPSIFPSIRVFSNESVLLIRWPKSWNFSFNISLFNEHSGLISFRMD